MIVYSKESDTRFIDYGIEIPIRYKKATMVYEALLNGAMKSYNERDWLVRAKSEPLEKKLLQLCHTERYIDSFLGEGAEKEILRTYELINADGSYNRYNPSKATAPLHELVRSNLINASVCCMTAELSLETGFSYFLGGGCHHAMPDYGSGFCLVNDVVLMARYVQQKANVQNVWIVDVDAHKGDGTSFLTKDDNSIRTVSIHMKNGWPLDGEEYCSDGTLHPSWIPSDIDIGIASGEESSYNEQLKTALYNMEKNFGLPEIAIIVGGVDPYEKDELESTKVLQLTKEMLIERDMFLYNFFAGKKVPQAYVMAGGYGEHSWEVYVAFLEKVLLQRLNS